MSENNTRNTPLSLAEFIWIWNKLQNLPYPKHHKLMTNWLSACFDAGNTNNLLMAFRSSGKSTLVGLFCAWSLLGDSSRRIVIMAADYELAKKMVRNIKRIIEKHPLCEALKPRNKDEWASDRFTVARGTESRDPSVLAKGLGGNITGARADIIICDDVEVPKNCDTITKRADLRAKLSELDFVLVPQGVMLYIGTPHTFYTIYATADTTPDNPAFLKGFRTLRLPLLNAKGQSAWPERFPPAKIASLRTRTGPNKFASQMQLVPVNICEGRLNADKLRLYEAELEYKQTNGTGFLSIGSKRVVSVSAWWDPSFGHGASCLSSATKSSGDNSVIAAVFTDAEGNYYLHGIKYISVPAATEDSATAQAREVVKFISELYLPAVHIETNGLGKFLPAVLRRELKQSGIKCAVLETSSHTNKAARIIEAFDAPLAAGALFVHASVYQTPFIAEMREWTAEQSTGRTGSANLSSGGAHDDGLDAVAGCLLSEPIRINGTSGVLSSQNSAAVVRPDWRSFGREVIAPANFNV